MSVSALASVFSERLSSAISGLGHSEVILAVVVGCVLMYFLVRPRGGAAGGVGAGDGAAKKSEQSEEDNTSISMPRGDLTVAELKKYDGSDPSLPVLVAAKGMVYDMTKGRDYYGRGNEGSMVDLSLSTRTHFYFSLNLKCLPFLFFHRSVAKSGCARACSSTSCTPTTARLASRVAPR